MAKVRTRMPIVFVGPRFGGRLHVARFRQLFKELHLSVVYEDTDLQTKHLQSIMKSNIKKSDFSLFDLSDWNPNVALELGLAEGLKRKAGKDYYILLNTRRSSDVPSDIRGLQRLEYTSYDYRQETGLGYFLIHFILSKEYWVKRLWREFSGRKNVDKKRIVVLRILSHLRDHERLTPDNLTTIVRGTRLRKDDRREVIDALRKYNLIRRIGQTQTYRRHRVIYKK